MPLVVQQHVNYRRTVGLLFTEVIREQGLQKRVIAQPVCQRREGGVRLVASRGKVRHRWIRRMPRKRRLTGDGRPLNTRCSSVDRSVRCPISKC